MALSEQQRPFVIRNLNDDFRQNFVGGVVTLTAGIAALGEEVRAEVLNRVRNYKSFTQDNDIFGEHDFGSFKIMDTVYFWRIEYYDKNMKFGSPDRSRQQVKQQSPKTASAKLVEAFAKLADSLRRWAARNVAVRLNVFHGAGVVGRWVWKIIAKSPADATHTHTPRCQPPIRQGNLWWRTPAPLIWF
jgi:hypothetical protein